MATGHPAVVRIQFMVAADALKRSGAKVGYASDALLALAAIEDPIEYRVALDALDEQGLTGGPVHSLLSLLASLMAGEI